MWRRLLASSVLALGWFGSPVLAQEPGWSGPVIARGEQRTMIEATPLTERPYRPLHFYVSFRQGVER